MALAQEVKETEEPTIQSILSKLRLKNERIAVPTSSNPQKEVKPPDHSVTHVYTKQHNIKGLQSKWKGPFKIVSRPTRSTVEIRVGLNKDLTDRTEIRSWGDAKAAFVKEDVVEASRPTRGRPKKPSKSNQTEVETPKSTPNTDIDQDPPFHGFNTQLKPSDQIATIDFSVPPPWHLLTSTPYSDSNRAWSATKEEIDAINNAINTPSTTGA